MWSAWLIFIVCSLSHGAFASNSVADDNNDETVGVALDTSAAADTGNETETSEREIGVSKVEEIAFCPEGWVAYKDQCLFFAEDSAFYSEQARLCREKESYPAEVLSEEKFHFIAGIISDFDDSSFMLALRKKRGYGEEFLWERSKKPVNQFYKPEGLAVEGFSYSEQCVLLNAAFEEVTTKSCRNAFRYICEKDKECVPGRFGPGCKAQCHCKGEPCNTKSGELTCKWGCEPGWTGSRCDTAKEQPEVRYFCINSPDSHIGSYVDVHLHTNGINYRHVYALMANSTEEGPWCSGTTVSRTSYPYRHKSINIKMNDTIADEIRGGKCVGQETAKNQFEWTLVIQEYEGIVLDSDLQAVISCDFNTSETLERVSQSGPSGTDTFAEKVELSPETTDVSLQLVEPFKEQVIIEAPVGTPVKLQIKFGSQEGSLVTGVRPHHCTASTPDGQMTKELLDHRGCTVQGSPVHRFFKGDDSASSISTEWFPLFSFPGYDQVEFRCSFNLCFHEHDCDTDCTQTTHRGSHRHRRSASMEGHKVDWTSRLIHIVPENPSKESEATDDQPITNQLRDMFLGWRSFGMENSNDQPPETENGVPPQPQLQPSTTATTTTKSPLKSEVSIYSLLNPIVFGVLLLLLMVSTVVFLSFHLNLKRTVEDMQQEMMVQKKSRHRMIHYIPNLGKAEDKVEV